MSATTMPSAPTADELIKKAGELKELLAGNAAKNEEDRRIAQESIDALDEAGFFRYTIPKRYGGSECNITEKVQIDAAVAEADGSTGWVVNLINVCNWMAALLPEEAQDEIFGANPNAKVAGVLNPTAETKLEDGGIRIVKGEWPWASGSWHADWALVGLPVVNEAGEMIDHGLAFLPMSEVKIKETWFVAGMQGTGSNTLIIEDAFVPFHRIMSIPKAIADEVPTPFKDETAYQSAYIPVLTVVLCGPLLGISRAARDFVIEKAPKRGISYTQYEKQVQSTGFQIALSEAAMQFDSAWLHAMRACADIDEAAAAGRPMDYLTKCRVHADSGYCSAQILDGLQKLLYAHGASSFAKVSPLQRMWRDANTGGRHAVINPMIAAEIYGKALVGVPQDEQITPLI